MSFDFNVLCWLWLGIGVLLILSEFILPGVLICFFGAGAVLVSVVCAFKPLSLIWQLILFAASGCILLFCCRRFMPGVFKGGRSGCNCADIDADNVAGARAVVVKRITPEMAGKVDFRGSLWDASADTVFDEGTAVTVIKRENLMLFVTETK